MARSSDVRRWRSYVSPQVMHRVKRSAMGSGKLIDLKLAQPRSAHMPPGSRPCALSACSQTGLRHGSFGSCGWFYARQPETWVVKQAGRTRLMIDARSTPGHVHARVVLVPRGVVAPTRPRHAGIVGLRRARQGKKERDRHVLQPNVPCGCVIPSCVPRGLNWRESGTA